MMQSIVDKHVQREQKKIQGLAMSRKAGKIYNFLKSN